MPRSMSLFYFSITLAIFSGALYHFSARSVPKNVNFAVSLVVTYGLALIITAISTVFFPTKIGFMAELRRVNWASVLLAVGIVGIEFGFLFTYRAGWSLGIAAVVATVASSLLLVPIAIFLFGDKLNWVNIAGMLVCLAGLVMLNWKR